MAERLAQHWKISHPRDYLAARLYDRHYPRLKFRPKSVGVNQITNTERALVLVTDTHDALWTTTWPDKRARTDNREIWLNAIFRNESGVLSSELITEAVAITRWYFYPYVPCDGLITYIAPECVSSEIPGYCYMRAKPRFKRTGYITKANKLIEYKLSQKQLLAVAPLPAQKWSDPKQLQMAI